MQYSGMTGERSQERSQSREKGREGDEERARADLPSSVHQCTTALSPGAGGRRRMAPRDSILHPGVAEQGQ